MLGLIEQNWFRLRAISPKYATEAQVLYAAVWMHNNRDVFHKAIDAGTLTDEDFMLWLVATDLMFRMPLWEIKERLTRLLGHRGTEIADSLEVHVVITDEDDA
jgi:hypothetical protein